MFINVYVCICNCRNRSEIIGAERKIVDVNANIVYKVEQEKDDWRIKDEKKYLCDEQWVGNRRLIQLRWSKNNTYWGWVGKVAWALGGNEKMEKRISVSEVRRFRWIEAGLRNISLKNVDVKVGKERLKCSRRFLSEIGWTWMRGLEESVKTELITKSGCLMSDSYNSYGSYNSSYNDGALERSFFSKMFWKWGDHWSVSLEWSIRTKRFGEQTKAESSPGSKAWFSLRGGSPTGLNCLGDD
jgi:hypothetical protein